MKVKNSLLELEKDFVELKDREVKIKRDRRTIFKPVIVSIYDLDKFERKEMNNIRPIKNTWYDWLINCIPEPIRKSVGGFKVKLLVFLRKIHLNKQCMGEEQN